MAPEKDKESSSGKVIVALSCVIARRLRFPAWNLPTPFAPLGSLAQWTVKDRALSYVSICGNRNVDLQKSRTDISHSRLEFTFLTLLTLTARSWLVIFEIPRHVYRSA